MVGVVHKQTKMYTETVIMKEPKKWHEEIDVIIVGSGFAGLAAAAEAAGLGAGVVILEKMGRYGGNSIISGGGYCAWDSKLHLRDKFNLGEDSWHLHRDDTLQGGDYYNIPELVEVMVKAAPDGLNWLIDSGAKIKETLPRIGGHSAHRSYHEAHFRGRGFTDTLKKLALSRGAEIRLNTKVTCIWRKDKDGPVSGVETITEGNKKDIKVNKALILASGGFSRDIKMRMDFNPSLVPEYGCTNHRGATGEIIRYAQAIWADTLHLEFIQLYPCADPKNSAIDSYALYPYSGTGYGLFYVDMHGRRFVNELDRRDVVSNAQIRSGKKPTYAILNGQIFKKLAVNADEIQRGVSRGRIIEAETIAELARGMGIPADALQDSVARHNTFIKEERDPEFDKPMTKNMVLMTAKPYYAIAQWPAIHHCMGGLRIDKDTHVIDIWGRPIPKLFAAGEVCGGIHGTNRLGGNAIPECIVFGRIAGINAAKIR